MQLNITKEWFEKRAALEDGHEIGAGLALGGSTMIKTKEELLARLARDGGCIVCSGSASELEIANAQACGRFYVDEDGLGFILRPKAWLDCVHQRDGYMQRKTAA